MVAPEGFLERLDGSEPRVVGAAHAHLSPEVWWQDGEALAGAKGRGGARVLQLPDGTIAVARDYRRGGLLHRVLGDRYPGPGRAFTELRVLVGLAAAGVPVVEPLAAVARRRGPFWRLRLITRLVDGAAPLTGFLDTATHLRRAAVEQAGRVVALAFDAGLRHPDLHPDNLLVNVERGEPIVRLIDLDRARLVSDVDRAARDGMLVRMVRYLHKHRETLGGLPSAATHLRFLRGYGLDRGARRPAVARIHAAVQRAVARHGLLWRDRD